MSDHPADDANKWFVYHYEHLDDLSFTKKPAEVAAFGAIGETEMTRTTDTVRQRLLDSGWEGDGELEVIWLPPFVDVGIEDAWGTYLWHVKQSNNGTSWIVSQSPLDFTRLDSQNTYFPLETHKRVSIAYRDCLGLKLISESISNNLSRRLRVVSDIAHPVAEEIRDELLLAAQGELIAHLNEFLNDCYLQVLIEVLENGNQSGLTLSKFRVDLNPGAYVPSDLGENSSGVQDAMNWFTIKGLIQDIWKTYKFAPYKARMDMLLRASEYALDSDLRQNLVKHVELRNCIQHHQRQLTPDSLQAAGLKQFTLLGDNLVEVKIEPWDRIYFSVEEIKALAKNLIKLAVGFDAHVGKRVKAVQWIPK